MRLARQIMELESGARGVERKERKRIGGDATVSVTHTDGPPLQGASNNHGERAERGDKKQMRVQVRSRVCWQLLRIDETRRKRRTHGGESHLHYHMVHMFLDSQAATYAHGGNEISSEDNPRPIILSPLETGKCLG